MRPEPPDYETFVQTRRFGEATVSVISEGTMTWAPELQAPEAEWRRAMPEADAGGAIVLGLNVVHIQIGPFSLLVDPGFEAPAAESAGEGVRRSPGMEAGLASLGTGPEQITHVLLTHAHGDHFAGVTREQGDGRHVVRFPAARHLIGRREWDGNPDRERPDSELSPRLGTVARAGLLDLIDGEREVVPGVTLLPAPGETPGHSIVRVRSGDESFYYLGDLFHHPCEVQHLDWVSPGRDRAQVYASRARLLAEAMPSASTLVFTHGRFPPWGRVLSASTGYRWEWEQDTSP